MGVKGTFKRCVGMSLVSTK